MWKPGPTAVLGNQKVYSYTYSKNNIRVLLCPVKGAAVTAYMRAVSAGSKDEAATVPTGAAHFIEHMSFRIQNGKIWSLASKGDVINAETNMDSTRFFIVHLPEQTEQTIEIDANRFKHTGVPAEKVPIEMKAVMNELERGEQVGNKMFQTTSSVAILEHPYHHSTIGTMSDVQATTAEDMEHFRAKYYVPNNTTLIFTGAINPATVLQHVETHFGDMLQGTDCNTQQTPEPVQTGQRVVDLCVTAPCPMTCMAFRSPSGATRESVILQCISRLTYHNGEGRASTLITDGTLHDVSTYAPRQLDPYLWFFHGTQEATSPEIRQQTTSKMLETLQTFVTQKVIPTELDNVKNSLLDEWNRSTESVQDMMSELGRCVSMGNWKDFEDRKTVLQHITAVDIQNVAAATFRSENMTITHVIPTSQAVNPMKTTTISNEAAEMSPPVHQLPSTSSKTEWSVRKLSPTTNLIHTPRASYVRATLSARFSPAEHDTASLLVAVMGNSGESSKKTSSALMSLHSERNFTHDHEFIHMSMAMPTSVITLKKASTIMFHDEWMNTVFDNKEMEVHKRHLISELQSRHTDQSYQVKKHFITSLFKQTQYNIPIIDRIQRIVATTTADIKSFHHQFLLNGNSTYVTMITPTVEAASVLGNIFPAHENTPKTTLEWESKERTSVSVQKSLPGYGSAAIMMGQTVSVQMSHKEKVALQCAASILGGGMTGRLMHTIREQRGLGTYGIYATMQTVSPSTDHIICIQGTFSPSSLKEGVETTKELIQEWQAHGVTTNELANAKERMVGSRIIAIDEVDQLGSIVLKCILEEKDPITEFKNFKDTVESLTVAEVNNTLLKYIDPTKFTEVIIGTV